MKNLAMSNTETRTKYKLDSWFSFSKASNDVDKKEKSRMRLFPKAHSPS